MYTGPPSTTLFVDDCELPRDIQFVGLATFSWVEDGKTRPYVDMGGWEGTCGKVMLHSPVLGKTSVLKPGMRAR